MNRIDVEIKESVVLCCCSYLLRCTARCCNRVNTLTSMYVRPVIPVALVPVLAAVPSA